MCHWLSSNFRQKNLFLFHAPEQKPASLNFSAIVDGLSLLEMNLEDAVHKGDLKRVKFLLGQGVDKDEADHNGWTALWNAAWNGHLAIVQYLVEQGADMEKVSNAGYTPLNIASFWGHLDVVRYLLEQGADRDKASYDGWTPLHNAARQGRLEVAMLLMSYGADLNPRSNDGRLPIDVAATEEVKQAIRDEPRRRMDEAPGKRATDQDPHPNAAISASAQQEEEEDQQINKKPRLDEGATEAIETKVAEEDEDSEPSSDEDEDN